MSYEGPGGDEPEPADLTEVRIGYFGPSDPRHVDGGSFWIGASRAIEEANREGGYKGLPFRLVARWSDSPWTAGGRMVVEMVYSDRVWAIIGSIDGAGTHIAEQVVAKAQVPLIDPASTDRSVNAAMVPWIYSCLPGDPAIAAALAPDLASEAGADGPVLLLSTGHDERHLAQEFKSWFTGRKPGIARIIEFRPDDGELSRVAEQAAGARAVLVLGTVAETAKAVRLLRFRNANSVIYAGPVAARESFLRETGLAADGVRCPRLSESNSLISGKDYAALQSYDAARLVVAAIRNGGLSRVRICKALGALSPWRGAAGEVRWSTLNRNSRPVAAGVIRGDRLDPFERPA
jgi:ABC-type branched-subunit amino acid transport system substrate-binding protein